MAGTQSAMHQVATFLVQRGLGDPDTQATLAEQGSKTWLEGVRVFASASCPHLLLPSDADLPTWMILHSACRASRSRALARTAAKASIQVEFASASLQHSEPAQQSGVLEPPQRLPRQFPRKRRCVSPPAAFTTLHSEENALQKQLLAKLYDIKIRAASHVTVPAGSTTNIRD